MSEVIRAGIQSIPKTLLEASVATGLTVTQAYRLIIIPIALRLIVPPLTNESLNLLKNSSLAMTIGVAELVFMTKQIETYTAKAFEALTAGTVIYLVLCLGIAVVMAQVEQRFRIPGLIARGGGAEA
jgi:ABC-type amino acid transport system permease subunit